MQTRSEAYFLQLFGAATLRGAAEAAASLERSAANETSLPIDVYKLAARKGFTILEDLGGSACEEGQLLPIPGGYRVRLRGGVPDARRRFSLAHEIGHSYFYRDAGEGPRHVIGVLNAAERSAEERICNLFAGTLLMPGSALRERLCKGATDSPSSIVSLLQRAASAFKVSIPALLTRIGSLELDRPTSLVVCSSFRTNPRKVGNPKLRIEFSLGLGEWSNRRFWSGTPVAEARISSALRLYETWANDTAHCDSGQFAIVEEGSLNRNANPREDPEPGIVIWRRVMGLWKREAVHCVSSSALYTWKSQGDESKAYVVTVIVPRTCT